MTREKMIKAILDDMDKKSDTPRKDIEKRFAGYLRRKRAADLEQIMKNRKITK